MCDVRLASFITVSESNGEHTEFVLHVSGISREHYLLYKRFSEFEELVRLLILSALFWLYGLS
jgi:hypothetical protein